MRYLCPVKNVTMKYSMRLYMSRVKPDRMCRKTTKKPETKNQQKNQGSQNNQSAVDTECHDRCEKKMMFLMDKIHVRSMRE